EVGYCTEFMIQHVEGKSAEWEFDELGFRSELEKHGDSVLVVADDDLVKVHLHAELPGYVLTIAQRYGELIKIKIENMREQHTHLLVADEDVAEAYRSGQASADASLDVSDEQHEAPFGFVAVSMGG